MHKSLSTLSKRKRSAAAIWCERIAVFLVPYFLSTVAGHRWQLIDTPSLFVLLSLGLILLLLAIGLGIIGLYQLWHYGHIAGFRTMRGMTLALIMLLPFGWSAWLAFSLPVLNDITTDRIAPPEFRAAEKLRSPAMNKIERLSDAEQELQEVNYLLVGPRRYSTSIDRVYAAVTELVKKRGWRIVTKDIPKIIDKNDIDLPVGNNDNVNRVTIPKKRPDNTPIPNDDVVPTDVGDIQEEELRVSYVEAVARSRILGFADDVVIRITDEGDFALVDMRSSSRWGVHDLGANATRIMEFLNELDKSLVGIAGEG